MLDYLAIGPLPAATVDASTVILAGTDPRSGGASASAVGVSKVVGLAGVASPRSFVSPAVGRNGDLVRTRFFSGKRISIEGDVVGTDFQDLHAQLAPLLSAFVRSAGGQYAQGNFPAAGHTTDVPIYLQWRRQGGGPHLSQEVYLASDVVLDENPVGPIASFRADLVSPDRFALRRTDASVAFTAPSSASMAIPATLAGTTAGSITVGGTAPGRVNIALTIPSGTATTPIFVVRFTSAGLPTYEFGCAALAYTPTTNYGTYDFDLGARSGVKRSGGAASYIAFPLQLVTPPVTAGAFGSFFDLPPATWTITVETIGAGAAGSSVQVTTTEAYS